METEKLVYVLNVISIDFGIPALDGEGWDEFRYEVCTSVIFGWFPTMVGGRMTDLRYQAIDGGRRRSWCIVSTSVPHVCVLGR